MDIRLIGKVNDGNASYHVSSMNGEMPRNQRGGGFRQTNLRNDYARNPVQNGRLRGARGGGRQQRNNDNDNKKNVTMEDLDADLDAYRAESKVKK
jgi:hypothetical protein